MATFTVLDRVNFGNIHCVSLQLTDMATAGSSIKFGGTVLGVKAVNNTDNTDTFKETVGASSNSSTRNQVTFTPVTADDDGLAVVWYR